MTGRREFLKAAGGVSLLARSSKERGLTRARGLVRRGDLGPIHFCRIAHPGLRATASYILDQADCVIEIEPAADGAAFLGTRATLTLTRHGWRVFQRSPSRRRSGPPHF